MMFGDVHKLPDESLHKPKSGDSFSDNFTIGVQISGPLDSDHSWTDDDGNKIFPAALKRLGRLAPGEIYGFVPALQLGGDSVVQNVHKFPIVEHLLLLASLTEFRLKRYVDIPGTFGRLEDVRPIGSAEGD